MGFVLVSTGGPLTGQKFEITSKGMKVGRQPGQNDVVVPDPEVSRCHARLFVSPDGKVQVEDSSANGTYVNEVRVTTGEVRNGDRIRFGLNPVNVFVLEAGIEVPARAAAAGAAPPPPSPAGGGIGRPGSRQTMVAQMPSTMKRQATLFMKAGEAEVVAAPQARLQLILDQYAVRDIPLTPPKLVIGAGAEAPNKLLIEHPSVSDPHAEFVFTADGRVKLVDMDSTNGTFVNGEKVKEKVLDEGDLIQLGACEHHLLLYRESRGRARVLHDVELNKAVVTLGRDRGNQIHLDHPTVSSFHAEILKQPDGTFLLVDKGSTNGTFANGNRVSRHLLQPRDRIAMGAMQFVFDGSTMEQESDGTKVRLVAQHLIAETKHRVTGKMMRLLDDVSIAIDPCEFVGLLGPSGAGKSTLMDALNGTRPTGQGRVFFNSQDFYQHYASLRAVIGYLPQEDILHRTLSVRECLYYAAKLRLPDDYTEDEIRKRVQEVMKVLDITERAEIAVSELSGGQRKRVSLGIELLSKPSLLFMDEPTAGQDPRTEMKMMQAFREIANRGATVVINTHLLGSFALLDKVAVLVRGKVAYFGPSTEMLTYFKAQRAHEIFDKLQEKTPDDWAKQFKETSLYTEYGGDGSAVKAKEIKADKAKKTAKHSTIQQLFTLLSRQMVLKLKDKMNAAALLFPPLLIAVLMGVMKQGPNEPKTLFMIVLAGMWFGCSSSVREIVDEAQVYNRERQRDLKLVSYLGSKLIYLIGLSALQSLLFIVILTYMGAQENHFLESLLLMWAMTFQGALLGLLISSTSSTPEKALYAFPLAMIPQLLLAGLLIPIYDLNPFYPSIVPKGNGVQVMVHEVPEPLVPKGMGPILRNALSPLIVSRWGMEAISDLYVHDLTDRGQPQPYAFGAMNAVSLTFHRDDPARIRMHMEGLAARGILTRVEEMPATPNALPRYAAVLGLFGAVMLILITIAMKMKDA